MKNKASIAEILHAKDPKKFAALIEQLIEVGLVSPQSAAGDCWFEPLPAVKKTLTDGYQPESAGEAA